jgi:hypothetical protein
MSTTIETASVRQHPETIIREEVTCIFCGLPTPIPASGRSKSASQAPRHTWIVRCEVCGKEAPYRICDLFEFGQIFHARGFCALVTA